MTLYTYKAYDSFVTLYTLKSFNTPNTFGKVKIFFKIETPRGISILRTDKVYESFFGHPARSMTFFFFNPTRSMTVSSPYVLEIPWLKINSLHTFQRCATLGRYATLRRYTNLRRHANLRRCAATCVGAPLWVGVKNSKHTRALQSAGHPPPRSSHRRLTWNILVPTAVQRRFRSTTFY